MNANLSLWIQKQRGLVLLHCDFWSFVIALHHHFLRKIKYGEICVQCMYVWQEQSAYILLSWEHKSIYIVQVQ